MANLPSNEIAENIKKLKPRTQILCGLLRNCIRCSHFEFCLDRVIEASGITDEMLANTLFNRFGECQTYKNAGMKWNVNINEGK